MKKRKTYTEKELVAGCIKNNRLCQEYLYKKFFPAMYRMCRRYANEDDEALEILNAGFLKVFMKLDTFSFKGSLEGWIRRIVFHCLSDYYRKKNKNIRFLQIEDWDTPTTSASLSNLYLEDMLGLVDKLPKATREVFWLYAVEGYTHAEIGKHLEISAGTSKWHLSNARKKLKVLIDEESQNVNHYAG